jgi:hypothetical protein
MAQTVRLSRVRIIGVRVTGSVTGLAARTRDRAHARVFGDTPQAEIGANRYECNQNVREHCSHNESEWIRQETYQLLQLFSGWLPSSSPVSNQQSVAPYHISAISPVEAAADKLR